ncbi:MAG: PQQ-binding-like beta-propeller repeat protein, partial [Pirellulaceae bacterium]
SMSVATEWSSDNNIKWKMELPGPGSSSPIIVGDKVLVTCYTGFGVDRENPGEPAELERHLLCFSAATGEEMWRATVDSSSDEDAYTGFIVEHGYASSTPVSDGKHIFTFFGKTGVVAFDMDGNQLWQTSVGTYSDPAKWGGGASPILAGDKVIVNAGIEGHALVALNKADGSEAWRVDDEAFTNNWSTPTLVEVDGRTELVYSIPEKLIAFDPDTGQQLWHAKSPIQRTITASTTVENGVVFTLGGRQGQAIAVRCGGSGDVSDSHTVWQSPVSSSIGTPVVIGDHMYWLASGSIAMCLNAEDGTEVKKARLESENAGGQQRRPAGSYASPIVVGDKLFFVTRNGTTHVLTADQNMEEIAVNSIEGDDSLFNATPAVSGNQMFIRSDTMLYCISAE